MIVEHLTVFFLFVILTKMFDALSEKKTLCPRPVHGECKKIYT